MINNQRVKIGRNALNEIVVDLPIIGRFNHAEIEMINNITTIQATRNMFTIDGTKCEPGRIYELNYTTKFRLGSPLAVSTEYKGCTILLQRISLGVSTIIKQLLLLSNNNDINYLQQEIMPNSTNLNDDGSD